MFRKEKVAIVSDIEVTLYQIRVAPKNKNLLRFLWWPQGNLELDPISHRMKAHVFVSKSSSSCAAFALKQTGKEFDKLFSAEVSETVLNCFYVTVLLTSVDDETATGKLIKDLTKQLKNGWIQIDKVVVYFQISDENCGSRRECKRSPRPTLDYC